MKQIKEEDDEPSTKEEELVEVIIDKEVIKRNVLVAALLENNEREKLVEFLKNNQYVCAWSYKDMPGIDLAYMCHELKIDLIYPAVKQKSWRFSP